MVSSPQKRWKASVFSQENHWKKRRNLTLVLSWFKKGEHIQTDESYFALSHLFWDCSLLPSQFSGVGSVTETPSLADELTLIAGGHRWTSTKQARVMVASGVTKHGNWRGIVRCHVWLPQGNPVFFQWVSCQITFETLPALPLSPAARKTQQFWGRRLCRSRDTGGVRGQKRKSDWHLGLKYPTQEPSQKNLTVNKHSSLQLHFFLYIGF